MKRPPRLAGRLRLGESARQGMGTVRTARHDFDVRERNDGRLAVGHDRDRLLERSARPRDVLLLLLECPHEERAEILRQRLAGNFQTALERRASLPQLACEMKNVSQSNVGQRVVLVVAQRLPVLLFGLVKQRQPLSVGAFSY